MNPIPDLRQTPLHAAHVSLGAKMGGFAGYDMPLYYADGVMQEHLWTRAQAGLFDVSHMGQIVLRGEGVFDLLERLTPSVFKSLSPMAAKYTVLMNEQGGIIDDMIVTRWGETEAFIVLNAGCKDKDIAWITSHVTAGMTMQILDSRALLALQGPQAAAVVRDVMGLDTTDLPYMRMRIVGEVYISRLGYTGEDGFEISIPQDQANKVWQDLLMDPRVKPIGLAARDTLRLEMQYCLYGHEIDDTTSPLEAGLQWVMRKTEPVCIGAARLRHEMRDGVKRIRVGLTLLEKGVAREGAIITDSDNNQIGSITSGGFSPSLQQAIALGYVTPALAQEGQHVCVVVRDRVIPARITRQAFMPAKTKTKEKAL
ncbi:MAG: glycine cleavage system aminomethyltransferase GcvT [Pseudomonadota bacterium]